MKRFAPLVESGIKKQTIRPIPSRMPRIGEEFVGFEWTGRPYNSAQRVLITSTITDVWHVNVSCEGVFRIDLSLNTCEPLDFDQFAQFDGFKDWPDMKEWFSNTHRLPFGGCCIFWK